MINDQTRRQVPFLLTAKTPQGGPELGKELLGVGKVEGGPQKFATLRCAKV